MNEDLDEFFKTTSGEANVSDQEPETGPQGQPDPQPETETQDEPAQSPEEVTKGEEEHEVPPTPKEEPSTVPLTALQDERAKRQQLEQRLAQLQEGVGEKPDPVTDPEGAYVALQSDVQSQLLNMRIDMSRQVAVQNLQDYEEVEAKFMELAGQDPTYWTQVAQSANPAMTTYQLGKQLMLQQEIGNDPEAYKAKLIEEGKRQALAEIEAAKAEEVKKATAASLPSDLSGPSIPAGEATSWQGPDKPEEIFPN